MNVVFIGGALDGELREVPAECLVEGIATHLGEYDVVRVLDRLDYVSREHRYHIANGIARHESVSEEEVARLVRRWMLASARVESTPSGTPDWVKNQPWSW